jgi:hypothetical protein
METEATYETGAPPDGIEVRLPNTISDAELDVLILNLAQATRDNGSDGFTDADVQAVVEWAHNAHIESALLDMVLCGRVAVSVQNGEVYFSRRESEKSLTASLKSAILNLRERSRED